MKIFPNNSAPKELTRPAGKEAPIKEGRISRKKDLPPAKKEISASEIKEKLAAHVETSDAAKNMAVKNTKKFGENFMSDTIKPIVDEVRVEAPVLARAEGTEFDDEIKTPNTKDLTIKSDIALNDPKDSNTQEKLKAALTRGAFSFNPKEREALEKILG